MNQTLPFLGLRCQDFSMSSTLHTPSVSDIVKATWIVLVTVLIVSLNLLMIAVLQSRNQSRYLRQQPRLLMTSLACTDLGVGLLVTPFSVFPTLYHCWPFGYIVCAMEALFISALFHQSTLSLMLVAIDRYICIVHPLKYHSIMTQKVCCAMIIISWITSFSVYSLMIYPKTNFFFDSKGIQTCEPFYTNKSTIIVAITLFYFPPLVVLLYCYLSIYFIARKQLTSVQTALPTISRGLGRCDSLQKMHVKEKLKNYHTALTLAAIACAFMVAVTPWSMTELISSLLEISVPEYLEFAFTWIAVSNSFWNPIIYGIMNNSFRKAMWDVFRQTFSYRKRPQAVGSAGSNMETY